MIVYKQWHKKSATSYYAYDGWFLFGIIPLYVRRYGDHE